MFINSIDKKPIFKKPDGIEIKDLTASMFNLQSSNEITYNVYRVPKDFAMRPDLIAAAVYNNSLYAEIILKYNGISNPFSINEGDIILIPNLDAANSALSSQIDTAADGGKLIRNSYKYIDPNKIPKNVAADFQNRQLVGGAKPGALPPNIAETGSTQISYRNGRVYFGPAINTAVIGNGVNTGLNTGAGGTGGGAINTAPGTTINVGDGTSLDGCPCLTNGMTSSEFLTTVITSNRTV